MSYLTQEQILHISSISGIKGVEYTVFDIETAPIPFKDLPTEVHKLITTKATKSYNDMDLNKAISKYKSLNPLFGKISCICLKGPGYHLGLCGENEKRILSDFWHIMSLLFPARMVSYNGKSYDTGFINIRSAINEIPSTYTISTNKWDNFNHFDVADIISGGDNYKKQSMDTVAQMLLGVTPKESPGDIMAQFYKDKKFDDILQHCMRDVADTESLFLKLNPYYTKKFRIIPE